MLEENSMELKEKVKAVIEKVRPALQGDGGDIELVDVLAEEKAVLVRLKGACFGCPMSTFTIKGYVEQVMKEEIPEISEVRLVK
jgi:Fe-S cluster biogenesis protein NfuA